MLDYQRVAFFFSWIGDLDHSGSEWWEYEPKQRFHWWMVAKKKRYHALRRLLFGNSFETPIPIPPCMVIYLDSDVFLIQVGKEPCIDARSNTLFICRTCYWLERHWTPADVVIGGLKWNEFPLKWLGMAEKIIKKPLETQRPQVMPSID